MVKLIYQKTMTARHWLTWGRRDEVDLNLRRFCVQATPAVLRRIRLAMLAAGFLSCGPWSGMAATWRWDTSSSSGYQAGNGVWESAVQWTLNGTALTNWPGVADDSVLNVAAGDSVITISSTVSVYGLQMADQNGRQLTVTGGTLRVGAGGLHMLGTGTQAVHSAVILTADQTWRALSSAAVNSPVYGQVSGPYSIAVAGDTFRSLRMYHTNNTYSGGTVVNNDGILYAVSADGGVPFGTGPLSILSRGQVWVRPDGTGVNPSYSVADGPGSKVYLYGLSRIYLNREAQNAVTLSIGHAADSGHVFVRTNRAVVAFMGGTGTPPTIGAGLHNVLVAGGSSRVPLQNGMVAPFIYNGQYQNGGVGRLLTYSDANGFTNVMYDVTNTFTGVDNTKKALFTGAAGTVNLNVSASVYAIDCSGTARFTLGSGVTLHVGDDTSGYSALFLNGNSVTAAVGAVGASLAFGANEAIIHQNNNATAKIGVPISGSNGVTFVSSYNGTLTLTEDNTYQGPTAVNGLTLIVGEGGNKGSLGASTNLYLGQPGTLQFNRSDTYAWSGSVIGSGALQQKGSGTLNVTATAGGVGVSFANISAGVFNLTLPGNNQLDVVQNTAGGLLTLNGDANATNHINGNSFMSANDNGTIDIQSGHWSAGIIASSSSDTTLRGTLRVGSGATLTAVDARGVCGLLLIDGGDMVADSIEFGSRDNVTTDGSGGRLVVSNGTFTSSSSLAGLGNRQGFDGRQTGGTVYFSAPPGVTFLGGVSTRSDPSRIVTNTYSLQGGTLLISPIFRGQSTTGRTNVNRFVFSGGTLAASILDFGLINGGILTNSGGALAPGGLGTAGRTYVNTGSYIVNHASASLRIDLGGVRQADTFQNGAGNYDHFLITGTAALGGNLTVELINGYTPDPGTTYTILKANSGISGTFATTNLPALSFNRQWQVTYTATTVELTVLGKDGLGPIFYWDANGPASGIGGAGNWDTNSALWRTPGSSDGLTTWRNVSVTDDPDDVAFFSTPGDTVTIVDPVRVNKLYFYSNNIKLTNGTITLTGTSASGIDKAGYLFHGIYSTLAGTNDLWLLSTGQDLPLYGNNTYSGSTTISNGQVKVGHTNAFGSTSGSTTVKNGGSINLNGLSLSEPMTMESGSAFYNLDSAVSVVHSTVSGSGTYQVDLSVGPVTLSRAVGGTLNKKGASALTLGGSSANTSVGLLVDAGTVLLDKVGGQSVGGYLTVNAGTVRIGDNATGGDQLANSADVTINGGVFDLNGSSETIKGLSGSGGGVTNAGLAAAILTLNGSLTNVYAGRIGDHTAGGGVLHMVVNVPGYQVFSGANTYSGTTTITGGTLRVNGTHTGAGNYTVASGAVLGGSGTINAAVAVNGVISPGSGGLGTLTINGAVTWNGGANWSSGNDWLFDLGAANTADKLVVNGNFTKGSGAAFRFDFVGTGQVGTYVLIDWSGSTTFSAGDFSYANLAAGYSAVFQLNGSQLELVVSSCGAAPAIMLGSISPICLGDNTANLPYSNLSGSTYLIDFSDRANTIGNFTDITTPTAFTGSPIILTVSSFAEPGTYTGTVIVISGSGCRSSANFVMTLGGTPTPASITQGNPAGQAVCSGATGVTYSTPNNGYTYTWNVPSGASISGQGTAQITVNWGSAASGYVSVYANSGSGCGNSLTRSLYVAVAQNNLAAPAVQLPTEVDEDSFVANWSSVSGADSYLLDVASTANFSGGFLLQDHSVNGINELVEGLTQGVVYYYRVRAYNVCNTSANSTSIAVGTLKVLAGWDVSGATGYGVSPMAPTTYATNEVSVVGLTRGAGVGTNGTGASRGWGGTAWTSVTASAAAAAGEYATLSVQAVGGNAVSYDSISILDYRRSATGPTEGLLQYSTNGSDFVDIATVTYPYTNHPGVPLSANIETVLFDLGPNTTPGNWNNVTSSGTGQHITDAVDSSGNATTIDLETTDAFTGSNASGVSDSTLYPITAQQDSLYLNAGESATIRIKGLDTNEVYDFSFFGSRSASDNRTAVFTIGSTSVTQNAANNTSQKVTLTAIAPNSSGEVDIVITTDTGASFGYLGVLEVVHVPYARHAIPQAPVDLTGITALQDVPSSVNVTFRLVNYGATSTNGDWYIYDTEQSTAHDLQISGYTCTAPTPYAMTGSGDYCSGSAGATIGLAGSQQYVIYQLYRDNGGNRLAVGAPKYGTGAALSFGTQNIEDTYTVEATRQVGGCAAMMTGSLAVVAKATPSAPSITNAVGSSGSGTGQADVYWAAPGGDTVTGYTIKRATSIGGPYTTLATVDDLVLEYTDATALLGNNYYYVVSAINSTCEGTNSTPYLLAMPNGCPTGQPPTLTQPGNRTAVINDAIVFQDFTATEASSGCDAPTFTHSTLPSFITYEDQTPTPNARKRRFILHPLSGDEGTYHVRVTATDSDMLTTSLTFNVYVGVSGEPNNGSSAPPPSQTNWYVPITDLRVPVSGVATVEWSSAVGVVYDIYSSTAPVGGGASWSKVVAGHEANGMSTYTDVVASGSARYYQVVPAGMSRTDRGVWGIVRPTYPTGYSFQSPPLVSDRMFDGEMGATLSEVLPQNTMIYIMNPGDNPSWTILRRNGDALWVIDGTSTEYTTPLPAGQGFMVSRPSGTESPTFSGPVGNDGSKSLNLAQGYNIIGISEGKGLAASSAFESAAPVGSYDENQADQVVIQNANGSWRRLIRRPNNTWYDTANPNSPANTSLILTPGQSYYYIRVGAGATLDF